MKKPTPPSLKGDCFYITIPAWCVVPWKDPLAHPYVLKLLREAKLVKNE